MGRHLTRVEVPRGLLLPSRVKLPGEGYPWWKIVKPEPGVDFERIILSTEIHTYNVHYVRENYVPCYAEQGAACPYHKEGSPRTIHQGALAIMGPENRGTQIVYVTTGAIRGCEALKDGANLVGRKVYLFRQNGGVNSRLFAKVSPEPVAKVRPDRQVTPQELRRMLLHIWGVELVSPDGGDHEQQKIEELGL